MNESKYAIESYYVVKNISKIFNIASENYKSSEKSKKVMRACYNLSKIYCKYKRFDKSLY